jgi:ABC-type Zn2+ transport system substrate-binding protein/surface adhesin
VVQVSRDVVNAGPGAPQRPQGTEFVALPRQVKLQVLAEVRAALLKMTGRGAVRAEHARLAIRHNHEHSDYAGHRHWHIHEHYGNADHHHDHANIDVAAASAERTPAARVPAARSC